MRGVLFFPGIIIGQAQLIDGTGHPMELRVVREVVVFRIGESVFPDIGQSVRFGGVGPPVRTAADIVVLVPAWRDLLLRHDRIGPLRQQPVRLGDQMAVGRQIFGISAPDGMLHARQDAAVQFDQAAFALFLRESGKRKDQQGKKDQETFHGSI